MVILTLIEFDGGKSDGGEAGQARAGNDFGVGVFGCRNGNGSSMGRGVEKKSG